jgi:hypothetical protein
MELTMAKKYTNLYCVKCGAGQQESRVGEACPALVNRKKCKSTFFTNCFMAIENICNDADAELLRSVRISST